MTNLSNPNQLPTIQRVSVVLENLNGQNTEKGEDKKVLKSLLYRAIGRTAAKKEAQTRIPSRKENAASALSKIIDISQSYRTRDYSRETGSLKLPDEWGDPTFVDEVEGVVHISIPDELNGVERYAISSDGISNKRYAGSDVPESAIYDNDWKLHVYLAKQSSV